ncbi:hypothetical protein L6R49_26360 [Myxococcota bacterium]|nr:hypothetical protein [Myxococcota bacterium]
MTVPSHVIDDEHLIPQPGVIFVSGERRKGLVGECFRAAVQSVAVGVNAVAGGLRRAGMHCWVLIIAVGVLALETILVLVRALASVVREATALAPKREEGREQNNEEDVSCHHEPAVQGVSRAA